MRRVVCFEGGLVIALLIVLAECVFTAFTGQHVTVLAGVSRDTEEWYGGRCYWTPIAVQVGEHWYEARERACPSLIVPVHLLTRGAS